MDATLEIIEFLALAFDPATDLTPATADAIDVLAAVGAGAEDYDQDDEDGDGVEDCVDQHIRHNKLRRTCVVYRYRHMPAIEDTCDNDDAEYDDWDKSRSDDGPEDVPAELLGDEADVSLFAAPDVAERALASVLERKIPYHKRHGWNHRCDPVGTVNGRRVYLRDWVYGRTR